jgi:hypothetical protein
MLEELKTYFIEVILKKYGPSFVKGAIASLFVYFGSHQGLLNSLGITWDASGHTLDIDFDTLGLWAFTAGSGLLMAALTAAQHHTGAVITGAPQSGDVRVNPPAPIEGGGRAGDPPKAS